MAETNGKQRDDVYVVNERGNGKAFWLKVGAAFKNKDGSTTVLLDALPTNGKLIIRTPEAREQE